MSKLKVLCSITGITEPHTLAPHLEVLLASYLDSKECMLSQWIQQAWQVTINPDSKHVTEPICGTLSVVKGSANNDSHHIIVQLTSQLNAESVLEDHLKNLCTYRHLQLQSSTNWPPNTKLYDMPFLPRCWQLKYNLHHYYSIAKSLDLTFNAEGNLWPPATSFPSLGYNYLNSLSSGMATLNYIMHFQSKLLETVQ